MIMDGTAESISQSVTEHQLCGSFLIYEKQSGRQSLEVGAKKGKSTILHYYQLPQLGCSC